jgi:hypothetical protein
MARLWATLPAPHEVEQAAESVHSPTMQSTGQGKGLQVWEMLSTSAQGWPPFWAGTSTTRVRVSTPDPHVAEQDEETQSLRTQFTGTGQAGAWQGTLRWSASLLGHSRPPLTG